MYHHPMDALLFLVTFLHTCGAPSTHADVLGHFGDKGQAVQSSLINAAHLVVHEHAGQQHCQGEDLCAILASLRPCMLIVSHEQPQK